MPHPFVALLLLTTALVSGCGAGHAASTPPAPAPSSRSPEPVCPRNAPDRPSDTTERLAAFKQSLSRCLLTGERPRDATAMVFVLNVGEDGVVRHSEVLEGSTGPQLESCAEQGLQDLRFEPFCGADVELRWRIQVQ